MIYVYCMPEPGIQVCIVHNRRLVHLLLQCGAGAPCPAHGTPVLSVLMCDSVEL